MSSSDSAKRDQRAPVYEFGEFTLDTARGVVTKGSTTLNLRPQSYRVLRYLVEHSGLLVRRDALFEAVWPGSAVTDNSLTQCVTEIRRAIGDSSRTLIKTVPRRGFVFDAQVSTRDAEAAAPVPVPRRLRLGHALVVAAAIVASALWLVSRTGSDATGPPDDETRISIAVLPFDDMSEHRDMRYFSEGIAEEILNRLAQHPELRVIARSSSFAFAARGADIGKMKAQLGVDFVLEGSVRRAEDDTRIIAQLIDAHSEEHVWSKTFDPDLSVSNLIAVQTEIAERVAESVGVSAGLPAGNSASSLPRVEQATLDHYLAGQYFLRRIETGQSRDYDEAINAFEASIATNASWAPAHAALGRTLHFKASGVRWPTTAQETYERSRRHLEQAIELDPDYPHSYASLAFVLRSFDMNFAEAERLYRKGFALGGRGHWGYAILLATVGRRDEANEQFRLALLTDPISEMVKLQYAWSLTCGKRYEESLAQIAEFEATRGHSTGDSAYQAALNLLRLGRIEEGRKRIDEFGGTAPLVQFGPMYAMLGELDDAEAMLDAIETGPGFSVRLHGSIAVLLGQPERALDYLEKAAADNPRNLLTVQCEADTGPLWDEPRFRTVMRAAGFPGW